MQKVFNIHLTNCTFYSGHLFYILMLFHCKFYVSVENISVNIYMVNGFQYGILFSIAYV